MKSLENKAFGLLIFSLTGFVVFLMMGQVGLLLIEPKTGLDAFLAQSPTLNLNGLLLQQPSSSLLILVLAGITIKLGIDYLRQKKDRVRFWLGVNFLFWGLGAFFAGLSYQAFGYALKCGDPVACTYTDWAELLYMVLTVLSLNALLVAYAHFDLPTRFRRLYLTLAFSSVVGYTFFQGLGMLLPNRFMVSYEGLLVFLAPNLMVFLITDFTYRKNPVHQRLLWLWIMFIFVNAAYFISLFSGQGPWLMSRFGLWFNENDTLHVLLILWMGLWRLLFPVRP